MKQPRLKIKKSELTKLPEYCFLLYVLGVALVQIPELFTGGHYSRIFMYVMIASIVCTTVFEGRLSRKWMIGYFFTVMYLVLYYLMFRNSSLSTIAGSVRSALISILVAPILLLKLNYNKFYSWETIERTLLTYLLINILLYISRYSQAFSPVGLGIIQF